eukprot:gene798-866_t
MAHQPPAYGLDVTADIRLGGRYVPANPANAPIPADMWRAIHARVNETISRQGDHEAEMDEDYRNEAFALYRLFTEVAETCVDMFSNVYTNFGQEVLLNLLLECAAFHQSHQIARIPLKFFYELSMMIKPPSSSSQGERADINETSSSSSSSDNINNNGHHNNGRNGGDRLGLEMYQKYGPFYGKLLEVAVLNLTLPFPVLSEPYQPINAASLSDSTPQHWIWILAMLYERWEDNDSTILEALDRSLKLREVNTMTVSFNGTSGFLRVPGESASEALYRLMTNQLDLRIGKQSRRVVDWDALDMHIGEQHELAGVLKRYFLDKVNRHLVVTSHQQPFLNDSGDGALDRGDAGVDVFKLWSDSVTALSERSLTLVPMPFCSDVSRLKLMNVVRCRKITQSLLAAFYGFMPSLMYAVCMQGEKSHDS